MSFIRVCIAALSLGLLSNCSFVSTSSQTQHDELGANQPSFNKWSLAPIFPKPKTDADYTSDSELTLDAIGVTQSQFKNIIDHLDVKVVLPGGEDSAPIIRAGLFTKPLASDACLSQSSSWRISAVRFAPYEYAVPGIRSKWDAFAARQAMVLNQVLQMRLSIKPICKRATTSTYEVADDALHFTYNIRPSNAALADAVFGSAERFVTAALARDVKATHQNLLNHMVAINSEAYKNFRARELLQWKDFLKLDAEIPSTAFSDLETAANIERLKLFDTEITSQKLDLVHPGLKLLPNGQKSDFRLALEALIKHYAQPVNLSLLTAFRETGVDSWIMTNLNPRSAITTNDLQLLKPELRDAAKSVYQSYGPLPVETFLNVMDSGHMTIRKITNRQYYSDATPIFKDAAKNQLTPYAQANDFQQFKLTDMFTSDLVEQNNLSFVLKRFTNPTLTHATTTSCATCHAVQRVSVFNNVPQIDLDGNVNIHMLGNARDIQRINARTVLEIETDAPKLQKEIF